MPEPFELDPSRHNLNLLVTLRVLLETRSTVLAAERLHRTQSAVSHALGRLREMFDDPLFVREGWSLKPTPRALALEGPVERVLGDIRHLLGEPDGFDAARSERQYRLAMPDFCAPMFSAVIERCRRDSPGVSFALSDVDRGSLDALLGNRLDLVVAPPLGGAPESIRRTPLLALDWAVLCRRGHALDGACTLERWTACRHVQVSTGDGARSPVDDAVAALGIERNVACRTPDFLSALLLVSRTDLVFTAPRQPFSPLTARLGIRTLDCPIELPSVPLSAYTSARNDDDAAQRWLTTLVTDAFRGPERARRGSRKAKGPSGTPL